MDQIALQSVLEVVRARAGGAGSSAYVATIGNWLRDAGVTADMLPTGRLSSFLQQMPAFCEVDGARVIFKEGSAIFAALSNARESDPVVNERHGDDDEGGIREDLWRAMILDRRGIRWVLDLETLTIQENAEVEGVLTSPFADAPEQYLVVPTVPTVGQLAQARQTLGALVSPEQVGSLIPEENWLRHFRMTAPGALREAVLHARKVWIVALARTWLRSHGLPEHRFIRRIIRHQAAGPRNIQDVDEAAALRRALHQAIDRMTPAQLGNLLVPASVLVGLDAERTRR
jgi:hypothetical protein